MWLLGVSSWVGLFCDPEETTSGRPWADPILQLPTWLGCLPSLGESCSCCLTWYVLRMPHGRSIPPFLPAHVAATFPDCRSHNIHTISVSCLHSGICGLLNKAHVKREESPEGGKLDSFASLLRHVVRRCGCHTGATLKDPLTAPAFGSEP